MIETLTALAESDDLHGYQELAEKLLRDHGADPLQYHDYMTNQQYSEPWIGAHMLFYVDRVRKSLAAKGIHRTLKSLRNSLPAKRFP